MAKRVVAVIPARGGSVSIPLKNIKDRQPEARVVGALRACCHAPTTAPL